MASIRAADVKKLRDKTGLGMMICKEALAATDGDMEEATAWLRKKGLDAASKRAGRQTKEGLIGSYIHVTGKIGVMVEVNCESDFVARGDAFKTMVKNIAMHIAATDPIAVAPEHVPPDVVEKEKEIYREQVKNKPPEITEKIVEGKLKKFFAERCLLEQPYVKNTDQTVADLVKETISKVGENIAVRRFVRYELGEDL
ncbi:MAG TPA: translation elongation factor Ts [Planctomycetota bacterium]|nr:translation elongation factor Ts [Planctomycetota bacterium]HUV39780.1 translation elongation factor Ts [Planctomycetota bacterium]